MNINVYILKGSGGLKPFSKQIEQAAKGAIAKVTKKIPVDDVDVVFYDNPYGVIPEIGIGGYSPSAHLVFVSLGPELSDFKKTINEEIERTVAHELYHCLRTKGLGYGRTLLEAMVSEGLADHFDLEVTGNKPAIWDVALSKDQAAKLSKRAKGEYKNKKYSHNDWFFGSKEKHIPKWTGYTLGFKLVGDYLSRHKGFLASQFYNVKAKEFRK